MKYNFTVYEDKHKQDKLLHKPPRDTHPRPGDA